MFGKFENKYKTYAFDTEMLTAGIRTSTYQDGI